MSAGLKFWIPGKGFAAAWGQVCARAYAYPCICACVWATCNLVVRCSASSQCQSKLVELQCAHPALPGPHQLSPTDGSNHLLRCPSLPALSSSLPLYNWLLSKINSLLGSFSVCYLLFYFIFLSFCWYQPFSSVIEFSLLLWMLLQASVLYCLRNYVVFGHQPVLLVAARFRGY